MTPSDFTDANGQTLPNIVSPIYIGQDNTELFVSIQNVYNGGSYNFGYSSTSFITGSTATYNLGALGSTTISPSTIVKTGITGQDTLITNVTITAPSGYYYNDVNNIVSHTNGYTLLNKVVNHSGTISADLWVDSFASGNYDFAIIMDDQLDLSNVSIQFFGYTVEIDENQPNDGDAVITYNFSVTNFNSSTMGIRSDYRVTPTAANAQQWVIAPGLSQQAIDYVQNNGHNVQGGTSYTVSSLENSAGEVGVLEKRLYIYDKNDITNTTSKTAAAANSYVNYDFDQFN